MATPIDRVTARTLLVRFEQTLRLAKTSMHGEHTFHTLARLFAIVLGLAAIDWGVVTFPVFWSQSAIERTAAAIIDRDAFDPRSLEPLLPVITRIEQSDYCRPDAIRSASIIRLRLAEEALVSAQRGAIDGRLSALQDAVVKSLACAPSDSFLWLTLAWIDHARAGFRPEQLIYLQLSYRLGPYEGWIADRRNRLALSMFERLPPDLAGDVVCEFASMVHSKLYGNAISILTGPGWPIHDRLLVGLKDTEREELGKALVSAGYDIGVSGIAPRAPRPWYQ